MKIITTSCCLGSVRNRQTEALPIKRLAASCLPKPYPPVTAVATDSMSTKGIGMGGWLARATTAGL